jgi:hypothetical protein
MKNQFEYDPLGGPQSYITSCGRRILCKGGGGGGSSKTTQEIPEELKPLAKRYAEMGLNLSDNKFKYYEGDRFADLNWQQNAGLDAMAKRANQGSQTFDNAEKNLNQMMDAGPNPYLDQMYGKAAEAVKSNFTTGAINSGSFGNANQQDQFQNNLGDMATQMYGGAYDADQNRRMQAIGMAPQFANQDYIDSEQLFKSGQIRQDQTQQQKDFDYSQFNDAHNHIYKKMAGISSVLGTNMGGTSTTQTSGGGK